MIGLAAVAAFVFVNQNNLNYQREVRAEQAKAEAAKKQEASDAAAKSKFDYILCTSQAQTEKDKQLKANSQYETKDVNGGTVYHGNANIFDQIDQAYQSSVSRCASLYDQ